MTVSLLQLVEGHASPAAVAVPVLADLVATGWVAAYDPDDTFESPFPELLASVVGSPAGVVHVPYLLVQVAFAVQVLLGEDAPVQAALTHRAHMLAEPRAYLADLAAEGRILG